MQAETIKATGMQHKQTGDTTTTLADVSVVAPSGQPTRRMIDPELQGLRNAIDGDLGKGSMTWMRMV